MPSSSFKACQFLLFLVSLGVSLSRPKLGDYYFLLYPEFAMEHFEVLGLGLPPCVLGVAKAGTRIECGCLWTPLQDEQQNSRTSASVDASRGDKGWVQSFDSAGGWAIKEVALRRVVWLLRAKVTTLVWSGVSVDSSCDCGRN